MLLGNVLLGLGYVLQSLLYFYSIVLVARAVVSLLDADSRNRIVQLLHQATDPLLRVIRRLLPTNLRYFPVDIAFLVLLALVTFAQFAIAQTLIDVGERLNRPAAMQPV